MGLQTIYFRDVISTEYDRVLDEKMNTIKFFLSNDQDELRNFQQNKNIYLQKNPNYEKIAKEQKQERENINKDLYLKHCVIPIIVVFVIMIIIFFILGKAKLTSLIYRLPNLFLVVLIFIPQIILYLYVIKKYQYIGNADIIYQIYNKNNINKN